MAVGVAMAFVFGYFTLILDTNPVLAGIALNTFSGGLTIFLTYYLTGNKGSTQSLNSPVVPNIDIPIMENIPVIGPIVSGHSILTYVSLLLVVLLTLFFWKTPYGVRIRAVGENEEITTGVLQYIQRGKGGEFVEKPGRRNRQARWDRRNLRTVSTHVSVQQAARFGRWCRRQGTTPYHELRRFILTACNNERMREIARGERWD